MLSILSVFFFLYRMTYKRSRCTIVHTFSTFRFKIKEKNKNNKLIYMWITFASVKFGLSEKHTKFEKIFLMVCTFT